MQRNSPVRKPHTSTADLLKWSENPSLDSLSLDSSTPGSRPMIRTHQPAGGISTVLFGGQMTDEEAESLLKRWYGPPDHGGWTILGRPGPKWDGASGGRCGSSNGITVGPTPARPHGRPFRYFLEKVQWTSWLKSSRFLVLQLGRKFVA